MVRGFLPLLETFQRRSWGSCLSDVFVDFFLCAQCVGVQSGPRRGPVGIQSGSSRDPVVNSSREFAAYWTSNEFVSKVQLEKKSCGILIF